MKCVKCNSELSSGAKFCTNCGAKVVNKELNKYKTMVFLLAFVVVALSLLLVYRTYFSDYILNDMPEENNVIVLQDEMCDAWVTDMGDAHSVYISKEGILKIKDDMDWLECKYTVVSDTSLYIIEAAEFYFFEYKDGRLYRYDAWEGTYEDWVRDGAKYIYSRM